MIINYPNLDKVDLNDIEVQKDLIRRGVAVGMPGGLLIFTESVKIIAGPDREEK